eukprot:TRINITY_DN14988_c0_g1_i3.p1 TRINITY_DN14988_c0_g1~~TRINITY_DN14988_c0_g1_i3.p1  ORF type:complete len:172 (-),score=24.23 TRINITY_DN14988_c0_g1_i3:182-697(-)
MLLRIRINLFSSLFGSFLSHLILTGIFPVPKQRYFLYFHFRFPMSWSGKIHSFFAMNFFITMAITNLYWSITTPDTFNQRLPFILGNTGVMFIVFMFLFESFIVLACVKKYFKKRRKLEIESYVDANQIDEDERILRLLSFLSVTLESLALIGVTVMTSLASIKRNRLIKW